MNQAHKQINGFEEKFQKLTLSEHNTNIVFTKRVTVNDKNADIHIIVNNNSVQKLVFIAVGDFFKHVISVNDLKNELTIDANMILQLIPESKNLKERIISEFGLDLLFIKLLFIKQLDENVIKIKPIDSKIKITHSNGWNAGKVSSNTERDIVMALNCINKKTTQKLRIFLISVTGESPDAKLTKLLRSFSLKYPFTHSKRLILDSISAEKIDLVEKTKLLNVLTELGYLDIEKDDHSFNFSEMIQTQT